MQTLLYLYVPFYWRQTNNTIKTHKTDASDQTWWYLRVFFSGWRGGGYQAGGFWNTIAGFRCKERGEISFVGGSLGHAGSRALGQSAGSVDVTALFITFVSPS